MTDTVAKSSAHGSLDQIDQDIITLLRGDGRMAFTEIAKRLSIPEATARYRVQRLLQAEVIRIQAWPDPEKLGTPHILVVWLTVENGKIDAVAETLSAMPEVRFVATSAGRYNIFADIYYGAHEEMISFFSQLQEIPGIISYESQIILKLLKAEYKYTLN